SIGVSAVTAYTAHREWATRPPDERYASVSGLYNAALARRVRTEEREVETGKFCTEGESSDALVLHAAAARPPPLQARPRTTSARCPHRSRLPRSTTGCSGNDAKRICSSLIKPHRGPCTRLRHRAMHESITTSWPVGCSTSWATIQPGTSRSGTRTANSALNEFRPARI